MLNQQDNTLIASMKQMVKYCKDIQKLLKNDRIHFSKDEISAIEESNKQKTVLLDHLSSLLNELNSHSLKSKSGNFLVAVEETAASMNTEAKTELTKIITELKTELAACYECLIINSKVVYTNIRQLKTLWDRLLSCRADMNYVYDNKGNTK